MDIIEKIRKTDSNDSHLYKHDLQPALNKQIFSANCKYSLLMSLSSLQLSESMRLVRNIRNTGLTEYWIDCLIMLQ